MTNPYMGETSQQNKASGMGKKDKAGGPAGPSLRMSGPNWPKAPGKGGPNRNTTGVKKLRVYPRSQGI